LLPAPVGKEPEMEPNQSTLKVESSIFNSMDEETIKTSI